MIAHAINASRLINGVIRECQFWLADSNPLANMPSGQTSVYEAVSKSLTLFNDALKETQQHISDYIDLVESTLIEMDNSIL